MARWDWTLFCSNPIIVVVSWSVSHFSLAKRLFFWIQFTDLSSTTWRRHQHFKSQLAGIFEQEKRTKSQKYFNLSFHLSINIVGGKSLRGFYSFFTHKQHIHIFIIWLPVSLFCEFFYLFFARSYFFKLSSFHVFVVFLIVSSLATVECSGRLLWADNRH